MGAQLPGRTCVPMSVLDSTVSSTDPPRRLCAQLSRSSEPSRFSDADMRAREDNDWVGDFGPSAFGCHDVKSDIQPTPGLDRVWNGSSGADGPGNLPF